MTPTPKPSARRRVLGGLATVLLLVMSGCAGESRSGSNQPGVAGPPAVATNAPDPAQQTSISTSSADDLAAALEANDVDDPEYWAEVVINDRPYPPGEPGKAKLRQVLAQFRADPDTTTTIAAALVP